MIGKLIIPLSCAALLALGGLYTHPAAAKEGGEETANATIELDPLLFAFITNGRVGGQVQIELVIEVLHSEAFSDVQARIRQVRADFLTALTTLSRDRFRADQPINPDVIVEFLQPIADARLGSDQVAIYVKNALINPT